MMERINIKYYITVKQILISSVNIDFICLKLSVKYLFDTVNH